jgi:hypothetical protein
MTTFRMLPWSQRVGYAASTFLISAGWLILIALLFELPPTSWSRSAIVLQFAALLLAALLLLRMPAPRLILYPLILAGTIYVWDTTLPPSLPEGPLRGLVPRAMLLAVLADGLMAISRAQRAAWRVIQIVGGYLTLDDAAVLCSTTVDELRQRLGRAGRTAQIADDGRERVTLADLNDLI